MDTFAYAESFDEVAGRYRGLRGGEQMAIAPDDPGLLVRSEVAWRQIEAERAPQPAPPSTDGGTQAGPVSPGLPEPAPEPALPTSSLPRRYHGSVRLEPARAGRDASQIAEEVLAHLVGLEGADVAVTLEIEAWLPTGASEQVVRTVTENGRTLKFDTGSGFEQD
jgi:hypothetical protein